MAVVCRKQSRSAVAEFLSVLILVISVSGRMYRNGYTQGVSVEIILRLVDDWRLSFLFCGHVTV